MEESYPLNMLPVDGDEMPGITFRAYIRKFYVLRISKSKDFDSYFGTRVVFPKDAAHTGGKM